MPSQCIIHGCRNVRDASKGISLHQLPKDKTIQKQWVEYVSKIMEIEGIHKRILTLSPSTVLCSIHFEDSDFSNMKQYKMGFAKCLVLKKEAVPNIYEVSEIEPTAHKIICNKIIQQDNSEAQSKIVSNSHFIPYDKELYQAGKNDIFVEDVPILQKNISLDGFVENLEDIKIEECPILDHDNTIINLLDKEEIITVDYTPRRQLNLAQITTFSSSDFTHKDLENIDILKQTTSQNVSLVLNRDANNIENEVKYPEPKFIDSKYNKFENHKVLGVYPENFGVLENTPENLEIVGNTLEYYEGHQNNLEYHGVLRSTSENCGVYENIPGDDKILRNTLEYKCSNNSQISIMKNDEPINNESYMSILDEDSTSKNSNNIHELKPKTFYIKSKNKRRLLKGYKDMILMAISSLNNNKDVSWSSIYKYISKNYAHGGKNEKVISQCIRTGIKDLLSTGFIVQNGNKFEIKLESFLEIKRKYKDIILEAIASSTDTSGPNLTWIRNYLNRKKITSKLPFIKRCVEKLLSTGEIFSIGSKLKVSNISSEFFDNEDYIKEIEKEALNFKKKNLENKLDSRSLENIIEIETENSKSQNKNPKDKLENENAESIIEIGKENSEPKKKNPEQKIYRKNTEKVEDEDYRVKNVDMILSKEMEFNKKMKDKIFNEENYVDCTFKDCDLVIYSEHIEKHLQDHKSSKAKKYSIKMNNGKRFICTECNQKYVTFYSIARHIYTHFRAKAPNERVCNECGYKNKRLTAFKIHKCNNLNEIDNNSSKLLKHQDQLDATSDQANKKEMNKEMSDEEYNPSGNNDYYSSDSDIEGIDNDKQSTRKADCDMNKEMSDKEYNPSDDNDYYSSDNDMEDIDNEKQSTRKAYCDTLAKLNVTCTRCQEEFENEALCKDHLKRDHDIDIRKNFILKEEDKKVGIKIYLCLKCNKIFHNRGTCKTHISVSHPDIKYHCDQCEYLSSRRHLLLHIQRNHEYQISVCKICNKFYKNKEQLRVHMFQAHPSNPHNTFLCNACGKILKNKTRLDNHMLTHTGEKPFACEHCKFSTIQKYNLVVHMRSHERGTIKTLKM